MLILGIDTSGPTGGLGLLSEEGLLGEINFKLKNRHSERLLPNIDYLLQETGYTIQDLTGLSITIGPGSFTGLRIGLSTAKAFAQSLQIPLVGLSTLDVLAYSLYHVDSWLLPLMDARRQRVYTALYQKWQDDIKQVKVWPDQALRVEEVLTSLANLDPDATFYLVGRGIEAYREIFEQSNLHFVFAPESLNLVKGSTVAQLGSYYLKQGIKDNYLEILPNYLKKPQAEINWQKKFSSGEENEN